MIFLICPSKKLFDFPNVMKDFLILPMNNFLVLRAQNFKINLRTTLDLHFE